MTGALLGLPLEEALRILAEAGIQPEVEETAPPRGRRDGSLRVVRCRNEGRHLTVAAFQDPLASAGESGSEE